MENNSETTVETRDDRIARQYLEGKSVKTVGKDNGGLTHERVRQILIGRGIVLRKRGPITTRTPRSFGKLTTRERFHKSYTIIKDALKGDHWVWPHKVEEGRYGRFIIDGKIYYAHRAAWYLMNGRQPKSRLRKTCAIHNCVHPDHWKERNA